MADKHIMTESPKCVHGPNCCSGCGDDDISPNVEAYEISGQILCDNCATQVFEDNGQFGVGA